ncbi:MAG TPA: phosphoribosylanthranilate isomerase [Candidatus Limnocylindrales bacterium]|nr:phosphoribosylanthranilate isomerase [Candidatus Limnocylindrales bacterium]
MTRIKICGNTEPAGVERAVELGVDWLGFIFTRSKRQVTVAQAGALVARIPPGIGRVGVFIDEPAEVIAQVVDACALTAVQVYRPRQPEDRVIRVPWIQAVRMRDGATDPPVEAAAGELLLVDSWSAGSDGGGSGTPWNWALARELGERHRLLLSGGLAADNVARGIRQLHPFGVDVSSGVEAAPGVKDLDRLTRFVEAVREADA